MKKIIFSLVAFMVLGYQASAQAPPNDECSSATNLSVNSDFTCTLRTTGSIQNATSSELFLGDTEYVPTNDVWYSFTATASTHVLGLSFSGSDRFILEFFDGNCGVISSRFYQTILWHTPPLQISNLVPGRTYYFRVFSPTDQPVLTTYEICIRTASSPANDDCHNAITLPVSDDFTCTSTITGTIHNATNSDVWYSFTATAPINTLYFQYTGYDRFSFELFGGNCNELISQYNQNVFPNNPPIDLSNLVPGRTYYIRVFSFSNQPVYGTYELCIRTPNPGSPVNDDCPNAIALSVNTDESCSLTTAGTVHYATRSPENSALSDIGDPESMLDDDVWYTFTATAPSHKISFLNVEDIYEHSLGFEVLQGICGNLQSIHSTGSNPIVSGLTVGQTYYMRVFSTAVYMNVPIYYDVCIGIPIPPINDNCENAITVSVNSDSGCTLKSAGTLENATNSGEGENALGFPDDDVWYKFVATATSHTISLLDIVGTPADLVYEVMRGTCGGQLESVYSSRQSSRVQGLTVGTTYYIRVFSAIQNVNRIVDFNICVATPPLPPANDNCINAINLAVNPNTTCTQTIAGTITGATNSQAGDNGVGVPDDDVWYTFVATATSHKVNLLNVGGEQTNLVIELLQGSCNGGMTSVSISNDEENFVSGLTIGTTYYIRVFSFGANTVGTSTFNICVTTEEILLNDDCAGAIALTVNPDRSCASSTTGSLSNATTIDEDEAVDVWYTFVATAPYHEIKINSFDYNFQVYSFGETCEFGRNQMPIFVYAQNSIVVNGLTVGTTYLLRVSGYEEDGITDPFTVCINTLPPAPVNDTCPDATSLQVASSMEEGIVNATTVGATDFFHLPHPFCTTYNRGDVWFKVTIPSNGDLYIQTGNPENTTQSSFDSGLAVYSGTCNALNLVECNNDISPTNVNSKIILTGMTPGEVVYIRVWEIGNDDQKPFTISAWTTSLSVPEFDANSLKAYPNPVKDILNLSYDQIISTVKVYNLLGQNIASKEINDKTGSIDLSGLPTGPYVVQINSNGISKSVTIIKQ